MAFTLTGNELLAVDPVDSNGATGPGRFLVTTQAIANLGAVTQLPFKPNATMATMAHGTMRVTSSVGGVVDTTSNSMNCRRFEQAPATTGLSDITLAFLGFALSTISAEMDIPTAYTVTGSVEYPLGAVPQQVFFSGATSAVVNPGRVVVKSDPLPIYIPAGAKYAVKCYVTWTPGTFWLGPEQSSWMIGEWCNRGTGLADNTLTNTVLTQTANFGFGPLVYAEPSVRTPVIGFLGDSITLGQQDQHEPVSQALSWQRGLQGIIPSINMSIGGNTAALYLSRTEGRNLVFRNAITHLVMALGVNDADAGVSLATMQSNFQIIVNPFLARGVKVHAMTITPNTTSTDGFLTYANQTAVSAACDVVRLGYNAWLRANWQALGLSGIFDAALAVDPLMIAKWACPDSNASVGVTAGISAGIYSTINGAGVVTAVGPQTFAVLASGFQTVGNGYTANAIIPWTSYPQQGDLGSGAFGTIQVDGTGHLGITSNIITSGGSGYLQAPMINVASPLTIGGLHPSVRGYNEMIFQTGFGPGAFTL